MKKYDDLDGAESLRGDEQAAWVSLGDLPTMELNAKGVGVVDRYELIEKLGQGGFGAVYGARDTEAGILVALKALPAEVSCDESEMKAIRKNFALVSRLHHPHIASVLHLHRVENPDARASSKMGIKNGDYLVVMEYAPGATLSDFRSAMPNEKMTLFQTLEYARPIATALDYAHAEKVLHRDIKPQNIIISREDGVRVKVLDFGLAAEIRSSMSRKSKDPQDSKSGTPNYMAPEQWRGKRQDGRADQYALAATIYELLSGEVAFKSAFDTGNHNIMRDVVVTETVEPLEELTKKQNAVLRRAMSKEPKDRFGSCEEFVSALARKGVVPKKGAKGMAVGLLVAGLLLAGGHASYQAYKTSSSEKAHAELLEQEGFRSEAVASRGKMESQRRGAEAQSAQILAKKEWENGVGAALVASRSFENGKFEEASKGWKTAAKMFQGSEELAIAVSLYRKAKKEWSFAIKENKETQKEIQKYASVAWTAAERSARMGAELEGEPSLGKQHYVSALASYKKAVEKATPFLVPQMKRTATLTGKEVAAEASDLVKDVENKLGERKAHSVKVEQSKKVVDPIPKDAPVVEEASLEPLKIEPIVNHKLKPEPKVVLVPPPEPELVPGVNAMAQIADGTWHSDWVRTYALSRRERVPILAFVYASGVDEKETLAVLTVMKSDQMKEFAKGTFLLLSVDLSKKDTRPEELRFAKKLIANNSINRFPQVLILDGSYGAVIGFSASDIIQNKEQFFDSIHELAKGKTL